MSSRFVYNKEIIKRLNSLVDEHRELRFNQIILNFLMGAEHDISLTTWYDLFHEESETTLNRIERTSSEFSKLKDNRNTENQLTLF